MRDINRISRLTKMLENYWLMVPDWRFGQLIENLKRFSGETDLFYMEDDKFEELLKNFFKEE